MDRPAHGYPRLISAAAFIGAVVIAAVASTRTSPALAASASTPRCQTSGLVVWLNTQGNGAAGSVYYQLELTNLSGHGCTLFGYPGVSAVDLGGQQVGSAASRNAAHTPRLITLGNGKTATVVLRIADADNFPASMCRPVTAAGLRVYPPKQTAPRLVPFPFRACSHPGRLYLTVETAQKT
jgi:hypothetical protein